MGKPEVSDPTNLLWKFRNDDESAPLSKMLLHIINEIGRKIQLSHNISSMPTRLVCNYVKLHSRLLGGLFGHVTVLSEYGWDGGCPAYFYSGARRRAVPVMNLWEGKVHPSGTRSKAYYAGPCYLTASSQTNSDVLLVRFRRVKKGMPSLTPLQSFVL